MVASRAAGSNQQPTTIAHPPRLTGCLVQCRYVIVEPQGPFGRPAKADDRRVPYLPPECKICVANRLTQTSHVVLTNLTQAPKIADLSPFPSRHQWSAAVLVLSRKPGEKIMIGPDIEIVVIEIIGSRVRIAIRAPRDVSILRTELIDCDIAVGVATPCLASA